MSFEDMASFVDFVATIFIWIVIAYSLLSFVLSPYHPVRETLERIVAPFLNPIRQIMPASGMIDFSPLILIVLVNLFSIVIQSFLLSL
jgi:YggT family protein